MPETTRDTVLALVAQKRLQFFAAHRCEAEAVLLGPVEYLALCQGGPVREIAGLPVWVVAEYTVAAWGRIRRWRGGRNGG